MAIGFRPEQTELVLLNSIREISNELVKLAPHNRGAEVANTHWLTATAEDRSTVSVSHVVAAFQDAARALQHQIRAAGFDGTATFYVWHDEQAGQLRCSVSSLPPDDLPFGGSYRPTDDLGIIATSFLSDDTPGVVAWEDLEPAGADESQPDGHYPPFAVWAFDLISDR